MKERDVTKDFLLCNRCGTCRSVCPLIEVYREEWAGARGKIELAEAFFRGEKIEPGEMREVFDLCLHCMMCEENCPSGVRAQEIVSAVRAAMARRGMTSRVKRIALWLLLRADNVFFRLTRAMGLARKAPLHGVGGKSFLSFIFPILGWSRDRFIPLPAAKQFLSRKVELFRADAVSVLARLDSASRRQEVPGGLDSVKAFDLVRRVLDARARNLSSGRRAYFFVGHAVNQFFPEEGIAVARLLNVMGIDVLAPADQACCGAPVYWAGDIEAAREQAMKVLERFEGKQYDWIVSSCSSGSLMLRSEFPRLFDLNYDGYFEIEWDANAETFRRAPSASSVRKKYPRAEDLYRTYIEGKVRDINELVAEELGLERELVQYPGLLVGLGGDNAQAYGLGGDSGALAEAHGDVELVDGSGGDLSSLTGTGMQSQSGYPENSEGRASLRKVTYHHPCHLARGQHVDWQPEAILESLPSYRYVRMKAADRCCGGGGAFSFIYDEASEKIARAKIEAIEAVGADVVATACPLCRIQIMDMLSRRSSSHGSAARGAGKVMPADDGDSRAKTSEESAPGGARKAIPVPTPPELLLEELERILQIEYRQGEASDRIT